MDQIRFRDGAAAEAPIASSQPSVTEKSSLTSTDNKNRVASVSHVPVQERSEFSQVLKDEAVSPHPTTSGDGVCNSGRAGVIENVAISGATITPEEHDDSDISITHQNITSDDLHVDSIETNSSPEEVHIPSSTTSVRSSIYDSVQENGRTYHRYKEGGYLLPNDLLEQERLDLQHHLFQMTLQGKHHLSPIKKSVQRVLDIGTGTGIWAIEFASGHPSAEVIGTDLSPIQPEYVPVNCSFQIDDVEDPWTFSQPFDYIHGRLLATCFKNFPGVVKQAFENLQPGGYFELQDVVPTVCYDNSWDGTDYQKWISLCVEGGNGLGMDWEKATKYRKYLEEAGFVDVKEVEFAWPSNPWPRGKHFKTLGRWAYQNWIDGMHGISMATLTRGLGMTSAEVEALLVGVRNDLKNQHIHCYTPVLVVYGRKPA